MAETDKAARIMELLKQLQSEGAHVKDKSKDGSALTESALASRATSPQAFEAWVSWTKSI